MKRMALLLAVVAGLLPFLLDAQSATATVLRSGFEEQLVASVVQPTALVPTPDGRVLVTSKPGQLWVVGTDGGLTRALDIGARLCSNSERGLLGVAVDPAFGTTGNNYVYLYYTFNTSGSCPTHEPTNPANPVNRVSRFVMSGDTIAPASEEVLIDNIPSPYGSHNAGDLHFGKDGFLYVSVGDGGCDYAGDSGCAGQNDASRDQNVLLGKVLRIERDGGIPVDNPFTGDNSGRCNATGRTTAAICRETFAWGLRNPFRMALDPDAAGTRLYINDVGQNQWEEIDEGRSGADYGWNICEGNHDNPDRAGSAACDAAPYTPPVHEYSHGATGCSAITGGAFVPDRASWPASSDTSYLLGDYTCNKIFELVPEAGGGFSRTEFATGLGRGGPIAMTFGPYETGRALYYTTYANGGEVRRIAYTGGNRAPDAAVSANPHYGPTPLEVSFDGSASSDPDLGDSLTYEWDFTSDGTVDATGATTTHTYDAAGKYTATLTVRDGSGDVDRATVEIFPGNTPPEPVIESPAAETLFRVGQGFTAKRSVTDAEDDADGDPETTPTLEWEILRHHNGSHSHPWSSGAGSELTFVAPPPEDLLATDPASNYLEIRLTATDSLGLSRTVTRKLSPRTVDVRLETRPTGLRLRVNGTTFTAPRTFVSWEGYELNVNAPAPQTTAGTTHVFDSWSDGGAQSHPIVTGANPSTYTATYTACTLAGTSGADVLDGTPGDDVICGLGGNDTLGGASGDDRLDGGPGIDTTSFSGSPTGVTVSLATNSASGEGSDILRAVENLTGSSRNDTLVGSGGANKLTGGGRADTLRGGSGKDSVIGSAGADSLFGEGGGDSLDSKDGVSNNDSLDGGPGTDTCTTDATEASISNCP